MEKIHRKYLKPTFYMNFEEKSISEKAKELVSDLPNENEIEKGIKLFYYVRDEIKYVVKSNNEYYSRKNMRSTATLARGYGFCIQKYSYKSHCRSCILEVTTDVSV